MHFSYRFTYCRIAINYAIYRDQIFSYTCIKYIEKGQVKPKIKSVRFPERYIFCQRSLVIRKYLLVKLNKRLFCLYMNVRVPKNQYWHSLRQISKWSGFTRDSKSLHFNKSLIKIGGHIFLCPSNDDIWMN